ncbi:MAG: queuosine precursor transporter [Spirochaetaceae bacterium]|nr:queuosine precursor transporter [Spirochaetaceae bacterium]
MPDKALTRKTPADNPSYAHPKYLGTISTFFAAILILSNVASSAKIVDLGFSLGGLKFVFDGGTLLFPLSYVFGDIFSEVYGFRASRKVIWTGFACLALSSLLFMLLAVLPGDAEWQTYAGDTAYTAILGGMSSGGLALASLAGYLAGEFSNSITLVKIKALMRGRLLFVRTIVSTLAGEFLDSIVFVSIATAFGIFGSELFWSLVVTNYVFKCLVEVLMTPVTYFACIKLKKGEAAPSGN